MLACWKKFRRSNSWAVSACVWFGGHHECGSGARFSVPHLSDYCGIPGRGLAGISATPGPGGAGGALLRPGTALPDPLEPRGPILPGSSRGTERAVTDGADGTPAHSTGQ
ncbi:MAG: hypothetical protein ACE5I5_09245 [Candidatus Heimdallarchaeota archaeon]